MHFSALAELVRRWLGSLCIVHAGVVELCWSDELDLFDGRLELLLVLRYAIDGADHLTVYYVTTSLVIDHLSLEEVDRAVIDRKALQRVIGRIHFVEGLRDWSGQAMEELRPAWEGDWRDVSKVLDLFERVTELLLSRHLLAQDEHFA